jgi:hypothetical protein
MPGKPPVGISAVPFWPVFWFAVKAELCILAFVFGGYLAIGR